MFPLSFEDRRSFYIKLHLQIINLYLINVNCAHQNKGLREITITREIVTFSGQISSCVTPWIPCTVLTRKVDHFLRELPARQHDGRFFQTLPSSRHVWFGWGMDTKLLAGLPSLLVYDTFRFYDTSTEIVSLLNPVCSVLIQQTYLWVAWRRV